MCRLRLVLLRLFQAERLLERNKLPWIFFGGGSGYFRNYIVDESPAICYNYSK
ncbi:MAG: hypothetical protein LBG13_03155 [Holosporales bacterium]|nr:hypothetical protein [Holosporales bacterium]